MEMRGIANVSTGWGGDFLVGFFLGWTVIFVAVDKIVPVDLNDRLALYIPTM